jgi:hypothetical protein
MSTTNLGLDTIETTDSIQNAFLTKMNSNMQKLDNAYGLLKTKLLDVTEEDNLNDAIDTFNTMVTQVANLTSENNTLKTTGNATADDIMTGKTALVQGQQITGNIIDMGSNSYVATGSVSGDNYRLAIPRSGYYSGGYLSRAKANVLSDLNANLIPTINVTLTGDYSSSISGYGAGIDQNGVLVIWAMSSTTSYEHIYFVDTSIKVGTIGSGWNISSYDTGDPANVPHACTVTGLSGKSTINITLGADGVSSSYDYVKLTVTITAS